MKTILDLTQFEAVSRAVPPRTSETVFFHLAEELGEVSVNLNRPHKADEPLSGELADVLNCILDLYITQFGEMMVLPDVDQVRQDADPKSAYLHLMSVTGHIAQCLQDEHFAILKDRLISAARLTLYIYKIEYGADYTELQAQLDTKCAKWRKITLKE